MSCVIQDNLEGTRKAEKSAGSRKSNANRDSNIESILPYAVASNSSDGEGGAAGIDAYRPRYFEIFNSTITENVAADGTGGIMMNGGEPFIVSSTVTNNHSSGAGIGRVGGISSYYGGPPGGLYNSIVAGNTGAIPDLQNSVGASNFIGNGDGTVFIDGAYGNIVGTTLNPADPRLEPFSDNGGSMPTYALHTNSRAINAGNNDYFFGRVGYYLQVINSDQRGFDRFVNKTIDMGAVEYGGSPVNTPTTIMGRVATATGRGVFGAVVTIRDATGIVGTARTNSSGYYRVIGLPVDVNYTMQVDGKRGRFQPQNILAEETTEYVDFVAN